jgi:hypothetical protein
MTPELEKALTEDGYTHLREINGLICGLYRYIFTIGLVVGLDEYGYKYRYCYENRIDAIVDIAEWDGKGHPSGDWIKRKGEGGDISNPEKAD